MADSGSAPEYVKFIIASTSGMGATGICYPLDVVKFRMQVSGEMGKKADHTNTLQFLKSIFKNEGFLGFYGGLSASLLRQATYTGTQSNVYEKIFFREGRPPTVFQKLICGFVGGLAGGFVGVPSDVAMTRMAVDGRLPKEQRRNYTWVGNALIRIYKEEGFKALFRGTIPTITRAIIVNIAQFVTYSQTKIFLVSYGITGDTTPCHIISSLMATLVCTIAMLPPDIAKTRIQNMRVIDGKPEYRGILDVWVKLVQKEGVLSPWKGFTPMLIRGIPMGVVLMLMYETQFRLYRWFVIEE
ncbi:mitochondrial 2-oxoglutarate/malate carrier protein-like [Onthophagus taurus]|uniref:mitochondrial 2-oxoglutarate/malate carrier protein-like n=1 Tax=Onthophagus taurus TaxID=166361 RepID=UPI0039BE7C08